ncbi:MFS general substrate transporter, partial [Polychaeton citri CBS 116435]
EDDILHEFSPAEQKSIIHRIDRRLVVTVGFMYCISLMDRTNLSAAAIAGMNVELEMEHGFRYSIVTLVFFISYILFQPPATVLTRKIGPRRFLSGITFLWGCIMLSMGFANSWQTLAGLRVILGVFEAGFFPGCVYLLSTWFIRYDMGKRYAIFYLLGCFASACAGILAFGLMQMDGVAGYTGWRWIFIIEGIMTVIVAALGYVFLVPFPDNNAHKAWGFLNQREVEFIIARVNADRSDVAAEAFTIGRFLRPALDLKVWGFALIFCCLTTVSYALAYFLPIILRLGMGFSVGASQCLVAPPYAFAGIVMFGTAWIGDKYHIRGPLLVFNAILAIIGLALMGWVENLGGRYFGVFLTCAGANANIPQCMTYQANNIRGQWKRAFCSALLVGFGGVGGIAGSLVFRSQDSPHYLPGLWACMTASLLVILTVAALDLYFVFQNRKAEAGSHAIEGAVDGFRYT